MATPRARRLSERAAEQIAEFIATHRLQPGDLLPSESELMTILKVGRSSVREALRGLAVLGMVEMRQGQGTYVKEPVAPPGGVPTHVVSAALARGLTDELLEAREILEVRVARYAAQRATAEDLASLQQLVDEARAASAEGARAYLLGAEFHLGVARAAHNDVLEGFVASYVPLLAERGAELSRLPGYIDWEIEQHDQIREAIASGDARLAGTRMRDHIKHMVIHFEHLRVDVHHPIRRENDASSKAG